METGKSFNSCSKVDEIAEQAFHRKARRNLIVIVVSAILSVTVAIATLVGTLQFVNSNKSKQNKNFDSTAGLSPSASIQAICNVTRYNESCYSSMSSALKDAASSLNETKPNLPTGPGGLFLLSLHVTLEELSKLSSLPERILSSRAYGNENEDPLVQSALRACETLFMDAIHQVEDCVSSMRMFPALASSRINDIRTWLSTVITDQETCLDGLQETERHLNLRDEMKHAMKNSAEYTGNSLAIFSNALFILNDLHVPNHRRLLLDGDDDLDKGFPRWVHRRDERLLLDNDNRKPNLTVAKDGSGDHKTITEAVNSIPRRSNSRFVIYVKQGVYLENVTIAEDCWNVMLYGDGMNETVVSGSKNFADGVSTYFSATFAAEGRGFIARDMGFKNTAGPEKFQAVALRVSSDRSAFYRCSFDAYQDTLYTHSNRQFYRDCRIVGTIDFIFGNAAVIFQSCRIQPRQPIQGQYNVITAQGKTDPNQNTGISIHRCQITEIGNLMATSYLGRPWKNYSTTVIMRSLIGEFLDLSGWIPLEPNTVPPSTIFFGEYQNIGPGSATNGRVGWPGVRPNMTAEQASSFTVNPFIDASQWLSQARIVYNATL